MVFKRLARERLHEEIMFRSRSERAEGTSHEDIEGRRFQAEALAGAEALRLGLSWSVEASGGEWCGSQCGLWRPIRNIGFTLIKMGNHRGS